MPQKKTKSVLFRGQNRFRVTYNPIYWPFLFVSANIMLIYRQLTFLDFCKKRISVDLEYCNPNKP